MKDKIHFSNVRIVPDLPIPPLEKEYRDWKEGKLRPNMAAVATSPEVPAPIVLKKKPIDPECDMVADIERWMEFPDTIKKIR
ncbi:UNVERIFIED_ORG: hypothetical protein [Escherichia phage CMSTMSU]